MRNQNSYAIKKDKMEKRSGVYVSALLALIVVAMSSCNEVSNKGKKENYDSLFLGFNFGMDRKVFFEYCWEMNKQKKFVHGTGATSVQYNLIDEDLEQPVIMRFYPSFHEDKIYEMPVMFTYEAWAPWNKQYWSDILLEQMYTVFKKWYGDDFQVINHPVQGKVYAKFDGHRRINLFIRDDQFVQAVFTDMRVETALNEKAEEEEK